MTQMVNPLTLRVSLEGIVCYSHNFENNFEIKHKFTNYLKGCCCLTSDEHFSFKYFQENAFLNKNISKIIRPLLASLSVYVLRYVWKAIAELRQLGRATYCTRLGPYSLWISHSGISRVRWPKWLTSGHFGAQNCATIHTR